MFLSFKHEALVVETQPTWKKEKQSKEIRQTYLIFNLTIHWFQTWLVILYCTCGNVADVVLNYLRGSCLPRAASVEEGCERHQGTSYKHTLPSDHSLHHSTHLFRCQMIITKFHVVEY